MTINCAKSKYCRPRDYHYNLPKMPPPELTLRLKAVSTSHIANEESFAEALDVFLCMAETDQKRYHCRDYFARRASRKSPSSCASSRCSHLDEDEETEDDVDASCRFKMCEWAYRVCDHFDASRETVAVAFSMLDRFIDKCCCDRTAFKLASMTALHMAAKLVNPKIISMENLADLSRGEFDLQHIVDMERIILKTCDWTLHPPTVQAFIARFAALLPYDSATTVKSIYQRASFFAELSVYEYSLVTERRHLIAVSCILNAIEGIDGSTQANAQGIEFLENVQSSLCSTLAALDVSRLAVVQEALWRLYSSSPQAHYDVAAAIRSNQSNTTIGAMTCDKNDDGDHCFAAEHDSIPLNLSPVSVVIEADLYQESK
ncbi:G1/S-specific cyclin-E1 [Mayamaea pseudoterrestris]|nr:G1/S-specific cyclin-E1 [Mayamaea pseudoterrestris]